MDENDDEILCNGSEEDGNGRTECKKDECTIKMETVTLIGKGK